MGKKKIDKNQKKQKNKKNQKEDKEENKADFYLDDADADLAYNSSELEEESEHGSELDFDEKDYVSLLSIQLLSLQFEGGFDATDFCLKSLIYLEALLHGRAAVDDCAVVAVADELTDT